MKLLRPLLLLALLPAAPAAVGCNGSVIIGPGTCQRDGEAYDVGDVVATCGEECTCLSDGTFDCVAVPTLVPCDVCLWDGQTYAIGDSFPAGDGCNTCSCDAGSDGGAVVGCTLKACPVCTWDGVDYWPGDTFPAGDGCNECTCEPDGSVSCTLGFCGGCTYAGVSYSPDATFPAVDGCNTCQCGFDGLVSCTELSCACDPVEAWWASYVSTDPMECQVIDFACPEGTLGFQNACGCGCAQSLDACDPVMCMAPAQCPYSQEECA